MRKLVIIRGPSGSGKTTIARHLSGGVAPIYEADDFFGPDYNWSADYIGDAHKWCQLNVKHSMLCREGLIIVSNTSVRLRDMQSYIDIAEEFDYEVQIIRTPRPWDVDEMVSRNAHGVPGHIVERHIARYREHPNETEWNDRSIFE